MTKTLQQFLSDVTAMDLLVTLGFIAVFLIFLASQGERIKTIFDKMRTKSNKKEEHIRLVYETHDQIKELEKQRKIDVEQSIRHDNMLCEKIQNVSDSLVTVAEKLDTMEQRNVKTKIAEIKERLHRSFIEIDVSKKGCCTKNEYEAFKGLLDEYYSLGGNSFVKTDIEPKIYLWKIQGENDYEN